jgi:hypothetical protein
MAVLSGIAMIASFFVPTLDWRDESMFSLAMSGMADAKNLFVFPVMGAVLLIAALILGACNAYSWLRIIYLVPVGLMAVGAVESGEISSPEDLEHLRWMIERSIDDGGAAIWLMLGSFAGSAAGGLVGMLSTRVSTARAYREGYMFCENCGGRIKTAENFCMHCGAKVTPAAPVPGVFSASGTSGVSGMSSMFVNNMLAWVVAVVPLAGAIVELLLFGKANPTLFWVYWIINSLICYIDENSLKKAGADTRGFKGWVLIIPVYLYKRTKLLNHNKAYFIANIVSLIIAVCLT